MILGNACGHTGFVETRVFLGITVRMLPRVQAAALETV